MPSICYISIYCQRTCLSVYYFFPFLFIVTNTTLLPSTDTTLRIPKEHILDSLSFKKPSLICFRLSKVFYSPRSPWINFIITLSYYTEMICLADSKQTEHLQVGLILYPQHHLQGLTCNGFLINACRIDLCYDCRDYRVLRERTRSRSTHTKAYLLPQRSLSIEISEKVQAQNNFVFIS